MSEAGVEASPAIPEAARPMPNFDAIPEELRAREQWVLWKFEERGGKRTKVPLFAPDSRIRASSTNPETWSSFIDAQDYFEFGYPEGEADGIGFVFTREAGIVGIDFDHCRNPKTGEWDANVLKLALAVGSYTEISPSGDGLHVFTFGSIPGNRNRRGNVEIYEHGRYFTVTGNHLDGTPTTVKKAAPGSIEALYATIAGEADPTPAAAATGAPKPSGKKLDDNEIVKRARKAENGAKFSALFDRGEISGYQSHSEADLALCGILRFWTQDPMQIDRIFRQSALYRPEKWDRESYGMVTIGRAIGSGGDTYSPGKRKKAASQPSSGEEPERDETATARAIQILKDDPFKFVLDTFATIHSGDLDTAKVLTVAVGAQSCINTMGIQPAIGGPKGAGKTSAAMKFVHLLPQEFVFKGSFSSLAMFYHAIPRAAVILSDDTILKPETNDLVKRAMSDFQSETTHYTIDVQRNAKLPTIAPCIMWLFTSIGDQGDEQLSDRQFKISVSPDKKANDKYAQFLKNQAARGIPDFPLTNNVKICREMFREIKSRRFRVEMPFMLYVDFVNNENRRLNKSFNDFVAGVAAIRFMQRRQYRNDDDPEGVITLVATESDLRTAADIYNVNKETKKFALSKDERALWEFIWVRGREHASTMPHVDAGRELYEHEIIEAYASSTGDGKRDGTRTSIRRLLYGRPDRGQPGGITEKVPGCYRTDDHLGPNDKRPKKNLIVCMRGPELADYSDFYNFNHNGWEHDEYYTPDPHCPRCSHCSQVFP